MCFQVTHGTTETLTMLGNILGPVISAGATGYENMKSSIPFQVKEEKNLILCCSQKALIATLLSS